MVASGDALVSDEWQALGAPRWLAALLHSRPAVLVLLSVAVLAPLLSFRRVLNAALLWPRLLHHHQPSTAHSRAITAATFAGA